MYSSTKRNSGNPTRKRGCAANQFPPPQTTLHHSFAVITFLLLSVFAAPTLAQRSNEQLPPAWLPEAEELLILQDYPTLSTAAKGIGRNLRQTVGEILLSSDGIAVVSGKHPMSVEDLASITASVQREFQEVDVRVIKSIDDARDKEICVSVWPDDESPELVARVLFPAKHQISRGTIRVTYGTETWLSGETALPDHHIVARSERLADWREAKQQCKDNAIKQLVEICREHAQRVYVDEGIHSEISFDMESEIGKRLDRFTAKEFSQSLEAADAEAYRHAMLLDTSELNSMFVDMNIEMRRSDESDLAWTAPYAIRFGSVIALLLAVTVVYFVLDGLTQGYYNGTIKTGLTVFGIVGLVILFLATVS